MSFELNFLRPALKEWQQLDSSVREQFKSKLAERLTVPRIPVAKLKGHPDRYKIKLRSVGYRLIYEVKDQALVVLVIAVGKREANAVYKAAVKR
jgi:mRNA interferase RelE/StbE